MLQNYFNRSRSKQYSYSSTIINLAVSCLLLGTQAQAAKTVKPSSAFSVYGTSTSVKDLEKENQGLFYEIKKMQYEKIENIAREKFMEAFWKKEGKKRGVDAKVAQALYINEKVKITDAEIEATLKQYAEVPQLKKLSDAEKKVQITGLLRSRGAQVQMERIIQSAISKGEFKVHFPKPKEPKYNLKLTKADHLRYGKNLSDTKPKAKGCSGNDCPIIIVEYSEFQCPYCSRAVANLMPIFDMEQYKGKIVWAARDFPLSFHDRAKPAATAAKCSAYQGKYWEMYHKLFDNQRKLSDADFESYAKNIGLNMKKFKTCMKSPSKALAEIDKNFETGRKLGVTGTPAFFVNGRRLSGALPTAEFVRIIEEELSLAKASSLKKNKKS